MEKYRYSDEELKLLENSPIPFAIYQSVDKRVVTIVLSEGFFELSGYKGMDKNEIYAIFGNDDNKCAGLRRFCSDSCTGGILCRNKTIWISKNEYPASLVKSKFLKLNNMHVEYVMDCMKENTTKVRNIKNYLLSALFNAPTTMGSYYQSEVNCDFAYRNC